MNRKNFLKKSILGLGTAMVAPATLSSCEKSNPGVNPDGTTESGDCQLSPAESTGPFPNKSPADMVRENIISDRAGIPLFIELTIQDTDCEPLANVHVDVWHCDAHGEYSEYMGNESHHYLRGRQTTNADGVVTFLSIYPGWYPGRATHIHLEILDQNETSIRVTQIAFPQDISDQVHVTDSYVGKADTSNTQDGLFANSLDGNMADSLEGNNTDGYTLKKVIVV